MRVRDQAQARLREHEKIAAAPTEGGARAPATAYGNLSGPAGFTRDASEVLRMGGDELRSAALRMLEALGRDLPRGCAGPGSGNGVGPAGPGEPVSRR